MKLRNNALQIKSVSFDEYANEITQIRNTVFIEEQKIPTDLEWDNQDKNAYHFIVISEQNETIAYARLLPSGKLGRVAVLIQWRNQGLGSMLISAICENASKLGLDAIHLSSQRSAIDFYLKLGFQAIDKMHLEAGIEHQTMHKKLI